MDCNLFGLVCLLVFQRFQCSSEVLGVSLQVANDPELCAVGLSAVYDRCTRVVTQAAHQKKKKNNKKKKDIANIPNLNEAAVDKCI